MRTLFRNQKLIYIGQRVPIIYNLGNNNFKIFYPKTTKILSTININCCHFNNLYTSSVILEAKKSDLTEHKENRGGGAVTLSLGEKVKENTKTAGYGGIIVLGVAILGGLIYTVLSELFSESSPNNIYTRSFKICKNSPEVQDVLGTPIKCYGEESRRGWRRHVAHQEFLLPENKKLLRMRFYIEGAFKKGTVHVEKETTENGKYKYNYLIVDVDGYPSNRINLDVSNF